jgi:hypothetical protein
MQTTGILVLLVQIAFAVHALRRGYPIFWVFLIVFVPLIGCLLYIIMVLLPEFTQSRMATDGSRALRRAIDPNKALRELRHALEVSDTVANRIALAEELARHRRFDEAIALYERSRVGIHRNDPVVLLGLSAAYLENGQFDEAKGVLDAYQKAHPETRTAEADLLLARTLQGLGEREAALQVYEQLLDAASGPEVKVSMAALLDSMGQKRRARGLYEEVVKDVSLGNRHSQKLNRRWADEAKRALG